MIRFEMSYTKNDKVKNLLNGLSEAFSGQQSHIMLRKVAALYIADTENRFEKQYNPDRRKWAVLSPTTIRLKKRGLSKKRGPGIRGSTHRGVWTGDLATSLKYRIEGDTVIIGSDVQYAPYFHYGVKQKKGHPWGPIPARRFLGRNNRIDEKVLSLIKSELLKTTGLNIDDIQSAI